MARDVEWIGATEVIMKSDQEKPIVALLKNALTALRVEGLEQAGEEHSPAYDPQANGAVESAVGDTKGRLRTNILALEARLRHRIPPDHPIVTLLVPHVTFLMRTQIRGVDGTTAYQRLRGRPYATRLVEFGEVYRYKLKQKDVIEGGSMAARWSTGLFLGMNSSDNMCMIFDEGKLEKARSITRLTDCRKWNMERVSGVNITPHSLFKPKGPTARFGERIEGDQAQGEHKQAVARQIYLKRADFEAYGQTDGCARCTNDPLRLRTFDSRTLLHVDCE